MTSSERQRRSAAMLIWTGAIVATTVLFSRRIAGEFSPTSIWPAVLVSAITTTLSLMAWGLFHRVRSSIVDLRRDWLVAFVAWLPTWLIGLAVAPMSSPIAQGWLIGIAMLSGGFFALFGQWHLIPDLPQQASGAASAPRFAFDLATTGEPPPPRSPMSVELSSSFAVFDPLTEDDDESNNATDRQITQRMTRQTLSDGSEEIEGSVRVLFAAGQRLASVHVPFSPPFAIAPQVECELASDEEARWKVSVVYPYGMRIELKRSNGETEADVELSYSAICEQSQSDAA
jgi:hypothetical protein